MNILSLIIQLASGALGGNIAGKLFPKQSMGPIVNSIAGMVGGGLGGQLLNLLGIGGGGDAAATNLDIGSILSSIAGGGVGGGLLMTIIGYVKGMLKN